MTIHYDLLAEMPLEALVSVEEGQQMLGHLIATENLEAEVNQHLDLLDVPEHMRAAIAHAAQSKRASMAIRDIDAQQLFTDKEPGVNKVIAAAQSNKKVEIVVEQDPINTPSIS